ncbi:MAG TPA: BadF/BadG/BcrA/BcrD ATPase family protein [Candidatus Cybelea sp.]
MPNAPGPLLDVAKPNLFVGVDAGGSRTVAALARGREIVRTFEAKPANPNVVGLDGAAQIIASAIESVLAGVCAAAIVAGVAGAGSDDVQERLRRLLETRFPGVPVAVTHDARVALRAAVPEGDGIVLIAGTGSIAYAELDGSGLFAGGYGYLLGDRGSGYAIGAAGLREQVDAGDRELLVRLYRLPSPVVEIAGHARIVLEQAAAGDDYALRIVHEAAEDLLELIASIVEKCGRPALPLAFSGGLLREPNVLSQRLEQRIAEEWLDVTVVEKRTEPYTGALALARGLGAVS